MKYRKKPVVIDAILFRDEEQDTWIKSGLIDLGADISNWSISPIKIEIPTLEGIMTASVGDYIIKGINGEFYPCKPDIFEKTYERVV
jgi:hypothetical protein